MVRLIIALLFLIASVWVGVELMRHPGYLLLVYQPWMVQMPIWFAALTFIVILILFYLIITSIDRFQFLWYRIKNWQRLRREHQSYSKTQRGLSALIEENWKSAENLLLAGVDQCAEPLINYLGAAKAAHAQEAFERRDGYIQKAYQIAPNADLAIGLTQAELELEQDQLEHAAATLNRLRQEAPRHPRVLKLLEKVYVRLSDWQNLLVLLPSLRKAKVLTAEQAAQFEKNIYCELLHAANMKNLDAIQHLWNGMPRGARKNPDVICAYVKQLLRFPDTSVEIEELIRKALKQGYQSELVRIYGKLQFNNLNRQLVIVGAWLKMYGQRPELLLTLGKLCVRVQLWGKAKDYFEKCLALGANPEASLEYGKLLEHLDEMDNAMQKYCDGLTQCASLMREQCTHV